MITPVNEHVQIKPISKVADDGIMHTQDKNYDEKGVVVQEYAHITPDNIVSTLLEKGFVVFFDSWQAAKFNEDTAEEFWLVPFSAIRAYEQVSE